jgi:hypothetical protein
VGFFNHELSVGLTDDNKHEDEDHDDEEDKDEGRKQEEDGSQRDTLFVSGTTRR